MNRINGTIALTAILLFALILFGCVQSAPRQSGTLTGTISIGPICPVERNPPDPACQPTQATFDAYKILAVDKSTGQAVQTITGNASQNGAYEIELPAGTYKLKFENGLRPLSLTVEIVAGQTTTQDISIDTGIR